MAHLKGITLILICICIMQHFLQTDAQEKKKKRRQTPTELDYYGGSEDPYQNSVLFKGHFENKIGDQCTWEADRDVVTDSSEEDYGAFVLNVICKNSTETESLRCQYRAHPMLCPEYTSKVDTFWKQIGRSLKRQRKLCRHSRALVKAKMCRKAPRDAHFALQTTPTPPRFHFPPHMCPGYARRQQMVEEYCSSHWYSFCYFLIGMFDSGC